MNGEGLQITGQGITCNNDHEYTCHNCGAKWRARERWVWWPVRAHFHWFGELGPWRWRFRLRSLVATWGTQIGWDGIEQRVYARRVRIGPLVICFGRALP